MDGSESHYIDIGKIRQQTNDLAQAFASAGPIPHVVIDNVIAFDPTPETSFPDHNWMGWHALGDVYQLNKFSCSEIQEIPQPWRGTLNELNSQNFLSLVGTIAGIKKLIPDPYFTGGGLHMSTEGGILGAHTDFHVYSKLDLYRRVNVILYLNPDWTDGDGGELTIRSSRHNDKPSVSITPLWGRMVIFRTDDESVHGFSNPVGLGKRRCSLATYYYTALPTPGFSGDATTHWREHGTFHGLSKLRFVASKTLMETSRAFSLAAHLTNPNQGFSWWKTRSSSKPQPDDQTR